MNTLFALLLVAQVSLSSPGFVDQLVAPVAAAASTSFSDDFNRTDNASMGDSWTEIAQGYGQIKIASNTAVSENSYDNAGRGALHTTTAGVNQYARVTITSGNSTAAECGVFLRAVDASSPCYTVTVRQDSDQVSWNYLSTPGSALVLVQNNLTLTFTYPVVIGVTITGTGNDTVVRLWKDPTANAPDSASSWDSESADVTLSDNPASAADTGTRVGIGGALGYDLVWDNFFGGAL